MRVPIRVRPGVGRTAVGGCHDNALIVRVSAPAVDGRATAAALAALAKALGLRSRDLWLVSGASSRTKIVEIPDSSADAFAKLLDPPPGR
jgi:uncharacterized protein